MDSTAVNSHDHQIVLTSDQLFGLLIIQEMKCPYHKLKNSDMAFFFFSNLLIHDCKRPEKKNLRKFFFFQCSIKIQISKSTDSTCSWEFTIANTIFLSFQQCNHHIFSLVNALILV